MTAATGVIDAVSILALGRVFVANMTGNVVFLGMALAGAPGFSLAPSLAAMAGFLFGAFAGGAVLRRRGGHRGRLLRDAGAGELVLVVAALVLGAAAPGAVVEVAIAGLLAIAMGLQNAAARKLAVPDLTTTVLTMTLTGIAADVGGGGRATIARRVLAVLTMFAGALVGALLVSHGTVEWALGLATLLLGVVVLVAFLRSRHSEAWHTPGP